MHICSYFISGENKLMNLRIHEISFYPQSKTSGISNNRLHSCDICYILSIVQNTRQILLYFACFYHTVRKISLQPIYRKVAEEQRARKLSQSHLQEVVASRFRSRRNGIQANPGLHETNSCYLLRLHSMLDLQLCISPGRFDLTFTMNFKIALEFTDEGAKAQ